MLNCIHLIILWGVASQTHAYNWRNEDPSQAEPDGAISCDNLLPPFDYEPPLDVENPE
jgi:hypothetical protein